ncbi:MAG: DEAD/DEAH box helicase [Candidatus Eisenbacteria bacterium]
MPRYNETYPLLELLENIARESGQMVHVQSQEEREPVHLDPERPLPESLARPLRELGIERLYRHQAQAIDSIRAGKNTVVVTGTASGKSLCYNLPVLESIGEDPRARALYLFPTKALSQDQLKVLRRFLPEGRDLMPAGRAGRGGRTGRDSRGAGASRGAGGHDAAARGGAVPGLGFPGAEHIDFRAGTYDGDTPPELRTRLRDEANILLTNPDMLHAGVLPNHGRWAEFFSRLSYVVIDEIHVYRGIFGSHVSNVMRRLRRICRHHGADPIWICASATIANPGGLAEDLIGDEVNVVNEDGSPRGRKHFVFWNPPNYGPTGMERRSSNLEAKDLFVRLIKEGYQTIAFVKARLLAEVLLRYCQDDLRNAGGGLSSRIRAYRAGYLPEERRKIESALFDGDLLGVISTNALELGIDVGSLDAAIMVGYPGTIASTWQQAGRAGRRQSESVAILVGHNAPIDQYLMQNPDYFFQNNPESAVLDAGNPHILLNHLRCATHEIPVPVTEEEGYGDYAPAILDLLQDREFVRQVKGKWFNTENDYPAATFSLRNSGENEYTIVDTTESNKVIGTIDEPSAFTQVHPQAVYMHDAETYLVDDLDLSERVAYLHKADIDYYTQAISDIYLAASEPDLGRVWRDTSVSFGECSIHEKVTMFKKIKFGSRDSLGWGNIELPDIRLHTTALWFVPSAETLRKVLDQGRVPVDGLVGIANVLCEVIALHVMCDAHDLGTVVEMKNTGGPTVFVYDKYPGGLGYGRRAFHQLEPVLEAALRLIEGCPCLEGCPSCVGSPLPPSYGTDPDVFTKGRIPDKEAALVLLHAMFGHDDYVPRIPLEGIRAKRAELIAARRKDTKDEEVWDLDDGNAGDGDGESGGPVKGGKVGRRGPSPRARGKAGASGGAGTAAGKAARTAREPEDAPNRPPVRPLPDDLRAKLLGQIERLVESHPGPRRRRSFPTERVGG